MPVCIGVINRQVTHTAANQQQRHMPQTFVALQCAFCSAFQSQLDKKSKKFTCAICNQKQSFRLVQHASYSSTLTAA